MALIDKQNVLSDAQAPTTGTTVSTNTIDLGAAGTVPFVGGTPTRDPGRGCLGVFVVQVVTTCAATGGASEVEANGITSAAANLGSPTVVCSSEAISKATLVAGYRFRGMAFGPVTPQRYIGCQYVITTNDLTSGAFDAWVALDAQSIFI
jgi:hypothetical protein